MQTGERRIDAICLSSKMKRHVARAFPRGTTSLFRFQKLAKFLSYPLFPRSIPLHSEIEEDQKHFFADFSIWPILLETIIGEKKENNPLRLILPFEYHRTGGRVDWREGGREKGLQKRVLNVQLKHDAFADRNRGNDHFVRLLSRRSDAGGFATAVKPVTRAEGEEWFRAPQ